MFTQKPEFLIVEIHQVVFCFYLEAENSNYFEILFAIIPPLHGLLFWCCILSCLLLASLNKPPAPLTSSKFTELLKALIFKKF